MRLLLKTVVVCALGALLCGCNAWLAEENSRFLASSSPAPDGVREGKAHFRAGDFGLAEASFRHAIEEIPNNPEAWLGLAAAQDQLGRFDLADKSYARLEKLVGPTAAFLNNRGYSYLLRGDARRARRDLDRAIALDPDNASIRANANQVGVRR